MKTLSSLAWTAYVLGTAAPATSAPSSSTSSLRGAAASSSSPPSAGRALQGLKPQETCWMSGDSSGEPSRPVDCDLECSATVVCVDTQHEAFNGASAHCKNAWAQWYNNQTGCEWAYTCC